MEELLASLHPTCAYFVQNICGIPKDVHEDLVHISMLGIISGLLLGILITLNLDPLINFIETLINRSLLDNYFINYFPYAFNLNQITLVLLSSFLLCFVSSVWPSTRAAKLNPNEVLRHE